VVGKANLMDQHEHEIRATLQPYTDDAGLAVPYETHVAVASA